MAPAPTVLLARARGPAFVLRAPAASEAEGREDSQPASQPAPGGLFPPPRPPPSPAAAAKRLGRRAKQARLERGSVAKEPDPLARAATRHRLAARDQGTTDLPWLEFLSPAKKRADFTQSSKNPRNANHFLLAIHVARSCTGGGFNWPGKKEAEEESGGAAASRDRGPGVGRGGEGTDRSGGRRPLTGCRLGPSKGRGAAGGLFDGASGCPLQNSDANTSLTGNPALQPTPYHSRLAR